MTGDRWQSGVVTSVTDVTSRIRRIEVRPEVAARIVPGAHVDVLIEIQGRTERRSYSVMEGSASPTDLVLSVAMPAASRGGAASMHRLAVGDRVRMSRPIVSFALGHRAQTYLLIAAGIGITAIAPMAAHLRARGADYRLVYLGRDRAGLAYLDDLIGQHAERIDVHLSAENGRVDLDALIDSVEPGVECYVCGPLELMNAVQAAWSRRGFPPERLRFETFANSGAVEPQEFVVRVPQRGVSAVVDVGESMLDALERAGVPMMYECRKGECGLCTVQLHDRRGSIDHRDVFLSERQRAASEQMCACVSRGYSTDGGIAELVIETT